MNLEQTALQLSNSAFLKFTMSFHIVAASTGIIFLSIVQWNRKLFAPIRNLSQFNQASRAQVAYSANGFSYFLDFFDVLFNAFQLLDNHACSSCYEVRGEQQQSVPSDILVRAPYCMSLRTPLLLSCYGSIFSQLAMAAERYRASSNLANYESTGRAVGHLLNAIHILATALIWVVHMTFYGTERVSAHCTMITPEGGTVHTSIPMITIVCEIVTITTFKRLLTRNSRLHNNTATGLTLSERYQLSENIRMLNLLLPTIWSHTSIGIIATLIYFALMLIFPAPEMYPLIETKQDSQNEFPPQESVSLLYLQGIFMPLIFIYRSRKENMRVQRIRSINTMQSAMLASYHAKAFMEG
ncbi:hypothetical protein PRIPAC_79788, partial [Pristionchus pacificus]|uniref:G protein-coupled receptor n=1 Tax=Pristionchus pacificus TaxID=54126 RepID=A0A2A6CMV7_PRIPA